VPLTDLPLESLLDYAPVLPEPADLDDFWASTLAEAGAVALDVRVTPVDNHLVTVDTFDYAFTGYGGTRIHGWLHLPADRTSGPRPAIVDYPGYGGGRGLAHQNTLFAQAGYAQLVLDIRGQGTSYAVGSTVDDDPSVSTVAFPGFMTRGILDPRDYYYRRAFTDAVRAIDAIGTHPDVDASKIVAAGGSQGGGIAMAVSGLSPRVSGLLTDVPFLCHFERSTLVAGEGPYLEIAGYLKSHRDEVDRVRKTLSYFDAAILARRATAPAMMSIALMDRASPPSSCFAAYNAYRGAKELRIYEFNGHEGGGEFQQLENLKWLERRFAQRSDTSVSSAPQHA
jgi:cephalosporin-C deacetylase